MAGMPGGSDGRFVIDRVDHRDELRCEVVCAEAGDESAREELVGQVSERIRAGLRFGARVVVVDEIADGAGSITDERDWA